MIVNNNELHAVRADHKDQTIALRFGCYDVLHFGHQKSIDFAASQADILAIGIMPDEYIARHKGRVAINPIEERVAAINEAEGVDVTFAIPDMNTLAVMRTLFKLRPNVYVEGEEHGEKLSKALLLGAMGVSYVVDHVSMPASGYASSSEMISRLGAAEAARLSSLNFQPTP